MANGNIDQLNFEVILDDKKFNQQIERDLKAASELNTKLSAVLNMKKRLNKETTEQIINAEKARQAEQKTAQEMAKTALAQEKVRTQSEKTTAAQRMHTGAVTQTNAALLNTTSIMRTLSQLTGATFSVIGIRRFLSSLVDITGQFEVQRMALRNMLQDIDGADAIFRKLYEFSSDSTYRFSELAKYAKQLAAFNIDQGNLLETTKMLGDVASGVGVSMDRLILAYGHVKSSGFLRGIQLRSFSQNGVPILEELSKMFTEVEGKAVSLGDVFDKMTKREIPFEMVEEAFRRMTSEGGKFYQMQEVLAKTLSGQINILKGRWENMLAAIGQANDGFLKGAVGRLSELVRNYEKFGSLLGEMIAVWGAYRAGVVLTTLATEGLSAATNIGLLGAMKNVAKWIAANPYALLAAAAVYATIEIAKASKALSDHEKILKALSDATDGYNKAVGSEIGELDALVAAVKNAKEGTDEYAAARRALENRFNPYIEKLREEGVEVDNLATLYDGLAKKIIEANKQRFLESAQKDLGDTYSNIITGVRNDLDKLMREKGGLSADQKGSLWHYLLTGEKNEIYETIQGLEKGVRKTMALAGGGATSWEDDKTVQSRLDKLRERMVDAGETYSSQMAEAAKIFDYETATATKKSEKSIQDWEKKVKGALADIDAQTVKKVGLDVKEGEDYFSYLERVGKEFKDIQEQRDKALKVDKPMYQGWIDAIKAVDKALEGNVLLDARYNKTPWKGSSGGNASDPNSAVRESLQADIRILEKYKSIYDRREAVFGKDAAIAWVFNNMGYDVKNLNSDLERLIAKLRALGDEKSMNAAESIEASLGLDQTSKDIKAFNEAEKALKAYEKALEKFDKDWGSGDTSGASYKAESVLKKYTDEKKKIEDEWDEFTKAAVKANKEVGKSEKDLYEARKKANENTMKEGLRGLVDDIFKEKFNGKELSDWSHKSLSDIMGIKKAVETMELPEDIKAMVLQKGGGGALAELQKAFDEYRQNLITGTIDPEFFKKSSKYAKSLASYISKAGDAMKRLGKATNDANLSDAGEAVSAIGQNLNAAAEGFEKSGSWIGAVAGGVVDILNQITDAVAESNEKMREMEATIRSIRINADSARFDRTLSNGNETIFGDNFVKKVKNAVYAIDELKKGFDALEDSRRNAYAFILLLQDQLDGTTEQYRKIIDSGGLATPGMADMEIRTKHSFWKGDVFKSLSDIASEFGMELKDVNGNLNPTLLEKVLEIYGDLNEGAKEWLLGAKEYSEEYAAAMSQIEEATKDIFGDLSSDLADKFIDNYLAMGNAVDDLSGTFANLGDAILRSFLQSYVLDEILAKYEADATAALKKYSTGQMTPDEYAAWLDGFAQNVQQEADTLAPAINGMIEAFKDRGLMNIDENTANSLGSGIKGITEETANLLASYINAIRADVSYMRVMQEKGWADVAAIAGAVASPTLNDYMAQIAASNYDIAQSNQRILSELQSVIGAPGTSGMVVRVEGR